MWIQIFVHLYFLPTQTFTATLSASACQEQQFHKHQQQHGGSWTEGSFTNDEESINGETSNINNISSLFYMKRRLAFSSVLLFEFVQNQVLRPIISKKQKTTKENEKATKSLKVSFSSHLHKVSTKSHQIPPCRQCACFFYKHSNINISMHKFDENAFIFYTGYSKMMLIN